MAEVPLLGPFIISGLENRICSQAFFTQPLVRSDLAEDEVEEVFDLGRHLGKSFSISSSFSINPSARQLLDLLPTKLLMGFELNE